MLHTFYYINWSRKVVEEKALATLGKKQRRREMCHTSLSVSAVLLTGGIGDTLYASAMKASLSAHKLSRSYTQGCQ